MEDWAKMIFFCIFLYGLTPVLLISTVSKSPPSSTTPGAPCSPNDTFCENVPQYPSQQILKFLKMNPVVLQSYVPDEEYDEKDNKVFYSMHSSINKRDDDSSSCKTEKTTTHPGVLKNTNGDTKLIMNDENFRQPVEEIKCHDDKYACFKNVNDDYGDWVSCEQKYKEIQLLTYDPVESTGVYDTFSIASDCVCPS